ncbi:hypothetical protein P4V47_24645 [Brevibacillus laterosporus]|uniref:BC1872 family protein n=1 Tax=Brevibacillus laterosporus TaxID=1465 RepID=UPI002E1ABA76|nr:hypothetical protein [Brevibacillus laterosporus]
MTEQQIIETLGTEVMGWELLANDGLGWTCQRPDGVFVYEWSWNPLENLSDAFQVMEKIGANKFNTEIIRRTDGMYFVTFKKVGRAEDKLFEVYASGETVQKAVCNAAMKVVS